MASDSVIYLCINLPWDEVRRQSILSQSTRLGVNLQLVEAVAGKNLTPEQRACYDAALTQRYYNYHLTDNEIACTLSHRKALEIFLSSGASYGVILEDDAILSPHFNEGIRELTENLRGWEVGKLQLPAARHIRPLPLRGEGESASGITPLFSTRFSAQSVGFIYTRRAVGIICEALSRFYLPADSMIGQIILDKQLPVIALHPELVTQEQGNFESTIHCKEKTQGRRSLPQYLRHRLRLYANNLRRRKLYRKVLRELHRVSPQTNS